MVVLGEVAGVHGIKGWLRVFSHTDPKENIFTYSPWRLLKQGVDREGKVIEHRAHGKKLMVRIGECNTREEAELLVGAEISVPENRLEPLEEGEYYWRQLEGLVVVNTNGDEIGQVTHLLETGANDVLVVKSVESVEVMIPWLIDRVIHDVDLEAGRIIVDWQADW